MDIKNITNDEAKNFIKELFYNDKISIKDVNDIYCEYKHSKEYVDPSILCEKKETYERKTISLLFGISTKQVYEIFGKTITYDDLQFIGRTIHLYDDSPIYDKANPTRLCWLLDIMYIYNEMIKIDKSLRKGPFYTVKNHILNKLIENGFLIEWHYEHTAKNDTYALQFQITEHKIYQFHQPIEYKRYQEILDRNIQTEDRDFYRPNDVEISPYFFQPNIVRAMNCLWKFLLTKPLKR